MKLLSAVCGALTLVTPSVAQIQIQSPVFVRNRFNDGLIQGSTAAFGTPVYGDMILGELVYGRPSNILSPHCDANYTLPPPTGPRVVVVERGGCQFADKVMHAQNAHGAAAVIVVDNDPSRDRRDIRLIIMADDDRQKHDIKVPSVLITHKEGQLLLDELKRGTKVLARMEWDMPNEHTVSMDMWASPAIPDTTDFLRNFAPIARRLKHNLDFVPHYWVFSLSPMRVDSDMCTDTSAKYCALDPDRNGNLTGRDTVYESVRQHCLWSTTATRNTSEIVSGRFSDKFWTYMELVGDKCPMVPKVDVPQMTPECSYSLMRDLRVNVNAVKMCVRDDFEKILDEQKSSLAWSPSAIMINNYRYAGPFEADMVSRAVCTGFHTQPEICDRTPIVEDPSDDTHTTTYFSWWVYVVIVAALLIVIAAVLLAYRWFTLRITRQLRYEVFEEVSNQLKTENNDTRCPRTAPHSPSAQVHEDDNNTDKNFVDVIIV